MGGRFRQPTSRWVGFAVAGAYVVITAITGTALLVAGQRISAADAQAGPPAGAFAQYTDTITVTNDPQTLPRTHTRTTTPSPTTVTTRVTTQPPRTQPHTTTPKPTQTHARSAYDHVTGPAGLRTVVPDGWAQARSTGPGAEIAVDPSNSQRYVKYGGSAIDGSDMLATHLMYEASYAARSDGYHRVALLDATFREADAVVWEFRFTGPGGTQHAKSLYWRVKGVEYFVLVSGPERDWSRMSAVYDQMVAAARP
ncbi:hypothetical protein [Labedaea rhizosphaerae]|uniref:Uncharacterized protein n=1 Tax=Labedaea rhizosphaerae TaxID=598644 RepID=A0A4R6SCC7_LABRH|nr:hypothetical protein [Labedaea rhizosphaerae]TDP97729.1 hypothetical protein EV186_103693 [Labedaea rhizosphaerae]